MKKTVGGAFLVVGTAVGAGMLSLPLITAACGIITTIILLTLSWSVMYFTSLKLLKLCSKHQHGVNFTTLIDKRMPVWLQVIFTVVYLLLLYSLMSAYTTQGSALITTMTDADLSFVPVNTLIFILLFGLIVANTRLSDYVNRSFLSLKFLFFAASIITMLAFLNFDYLSSLPLSIAAIAFAWPTLLPSFGFQNIVPVLYEYQQGDIKAVKRSVLAGSLIVLIIYIIWSVVCLLILPQTGAHSYRDIFIQGNTLNTFIHMVKLQTNSQWINTFLTIFINTSIVTSFICVGLSLLHYLKDTFKRFNIHISNTIGLILTFLVPYTFTVFYPKGFILALQYASIFAVFIFVFAPLLLDKDTIWSKSNLYPLLLGGLVIIAQILNLLEITLPF